ncbi:MAG: RNA methyltransferase [Eubacteriales bacterium]|nr:RNA methyltransferase [Eubacteriales bacterium]
MLIISSKNNIKIKEIKMIRDLSSYRKEKNLIFLEGERLINDTPIDLIKEIYIDENYKNKIPKIGKENVFIIKNNITNYISDTKNPQGIIAIARKPIMNYNNIFTSEFKNILILNSIKDPGNMGSIIRTSEASGISCIIIDKESVDYLSPKVIRSSMSSIFRVKIFETDNLINCILKLKKIKYDIYATDLNAKEYYDEINYSNNNAIVIGSEANGIDKKIMELCNKKIKIDMCGNIESLNASIATAIILFEMKRRRKNDKSK